MPMAVIKESNAVKSIIVYFRAFYVLFAYFRINHEILSNLFMAFFEHILHTVLKLFF